jgi:selenide,water dikinase
MGPEGLEEALSGLFGEADPNLIVGPETSDDAGVYRIGNECALVETTDIITPLVDDPFLFGAIAATNALSDVFAMGARPVTAMNLVFFPQCRVPSETLRAILAGGSGKIREAGACLVGGHTVEDDEIKYGLAVTGLVHPERVIRNSTARPGDLLVLTKPVGTGIISTGIKAEMVDDAVVEEACRWMTTLNNVAACIMTECGASACTDVTGFGLIGHVSEMARGAGVTAVLDIEAVPILPGVDALINDGLIPGGCYRNRDFYSRFLLDGRPLQGAAPADDLLPLFDPQTSGGLLVALPAESVETFLSNADEHGCFAVKIGEIEPDRGHAVEIR